MGLIYTAWKGDGLTDLYIVQTLSIPSKKFANIRYMDSAEMSAFNFILTINTVPLK